MSKKIIAISLALVVMLTCFTACKKKRETTKINGSDYIVVTDKNGNPIINEKNEVVVVVTDREGEVLTYENGEDQTRNLQLKEPLESDGVIHGSNYRFTKLSGWESYGNTRICKEKTDNKCYYQFVKIKELDEEITIESYLETVDGQNEQIIPALEADGKTLTIEKGNETISSANINTHVRKYKITDASGNVTHYAETYYFVAGSMIYAVNYACEDGIGYDASFDFGNYLKTGFTYVD